jgi:hypothetical protein
MAILRIESLWIKHNRVTEFFLRTPSNHPIHTRYLERTSGSRYDMHTLDLCPTGTRSRAQT